MSLDRLLDPQTGDYLDGPHGSFVEGSVVHNKLLFALRVPRGSWEGDPLIGHRFGELSRAVDVDVSRRIRDMAREATQWIVDDGDLVSVEVEAEQAGRGMWSFAITAVEPSGREVELGPFLVEVVA